MWVESSILTESATTKSGQLKLERVFQVPALESVGVCFFKNKLISNCRPEFRLRGEVQAGLSIIF